MEIDLLIIKPGAQKELYQDLSKSVSGREPPLWATLLAAFIRQKGFKVKAIDTEIEPEKIVPVITSDSPRLVAIVVSGTNPSASTMNMVGVRTLLKEIGRINPEIDTILIGLHPSALPRQTLLEESTKMVCEGEGFYTLLDLLSGVEYKDIKGLWHRKNGQIISNPRAELVDPNILPMPAWDLLPMSKYKAHNWHCFGRNNDRSPYVAIYTSLGCPFNCSFCCINAIFGEHKIRYRSPQLVIEEIDYLVSKYGLKNIKILDEMFDLNEDHVIELCDLIIERKYDLNIWAYARADTINERKLKKMKEAGINWLGIGFESGNPEVRKGVNKGGFDNQQMLNTAKKIESFGIDIGGNFIFGMPRDTLETMQETLDLAKKIMPAYANFYVAMPYPGSRLFEEVSQDLLPESWSGYSQYSYDTKPLANNNLTAKDILYFRDNAFNKYYSNQNYQKKILEKFGEKTLQEIKAVLKYRLKRKLLGD